MTSYAFRSHPNQPHQVLQRPNGVQVDGHELVVRALTAGHFVAQIGQRAAHVHAVAHGDTIHLQLAGRTCVIERLDRTRGAGSAAHAGQAGATAPMPGVVVSWIAKPGTTVHAGEALLVIESMKLQMTIEAPQTGLLQELPFQPGQTFQRGAVLATVRPQENLA
jgi:3-methylcrotonyl-CoA carboxylase alpha subunit